MSWIASWGLEKELVDKVDNWASCFVSALNAGVGGVADSDANEKGRDEDTKRLLLEDVRRSVSIAVVVVVDVFDNAGIADDEEVINLVNGAGCFLGSINLNRDVDHDFGWADAWI